MRFAASLLFICSLYDITDNFLNSTILNISVLLKLRVAPFTKIIPYVYKNQSFGGYLFLSYYVNYVYIVILFYINSLFVTAAYNFLFLLGTYTLMITYSDFLKKYEVKSLVAYSSITNSPLLLCTFPVLQSYFSKYSLYEGSTFLTFVLIYISIYFNNVLILNIYAYSLEPTKGKK